MAKVLWSADRRIWKDNGDPAADGTLAFRLADTSTEVTVYSDRSLSVSLGSSVNISSDGYLSSNVTVYGADDVGYDAVVTATGVNGGAPKTIPDVAIADSSVAADSYRTGFKNVVNNGDFAVWSDQTSYSNISGDDDGDETADGWFFAQPSAASNAVSRQTGEATASRYGLRFGRPAASTSTNKLRVWKMLTTEEVYRLRGQTVVFSVYLRSGANFSAASLNCKLATGTSEGEDGDLIESGGLAGFAQPINQNQAITTSITRYSFSATLGATIKEIGLQFSYTGVGTAGANDWVQIEQVQVEIATTVSEFEAIPETLEFLIQKLSSVARTLVKQTTQALMRTTGLGITTAGDALTQLGTAAAGKFALFSSASAAVLGDFPPPPPGGRLTLTTAVPVTTGDVTGATTIYYTPYVNDVVSIYNGTQFIPTTFTELSQATTDNTKSTTAVANNSNYDLFVWNDSGTIRCTRGPAWSSDTARGTGAGTTELELVKGIYLNKVAITNGPGANRGTYVGTVRSNGSAQINDSVLLRMVWNAYNRRPRPMSVVDTTDNWNYTTLTWRQARATATNQLAFVRGLNEDEVLAVARAAYSNSSLAVIGSAGIGLDSTSANSAQTFQSATAYAANNLAPASAEYRGFPGLGYHYLAWLEISQATGTGTFYGDAGTTLLQSGLTATVYA